MNDPLSQPIDTLAEFLVHAIELEEESVERYRELADNMLVHNNPEVAELFKQLADQSDEHAHEVRQRAEGMDLPYIPPWDFKWSCPDTPEVPCLDDVHYQMTKCDALDLALYNEIRGRDFYAHLAADSKDAAIRDAAAKMVAEEDEHVEMLKDWAMRESCNIQRVQPDLDPPHMPE